MFTFRHLNESVLHWLAQGQLFGLRWKGRLPVQRFRLSRNIFLHRIMPMPDSAICRLYLNVENAIRNCLAASCDVETCRLRLHAVKNG